MKPILSFLLLLVLVMISCKGNEGPDRTKENGVEVIANGEAPHNQKPVKFETLRTIVLEEDILPGVTGSGIAVNNAGELCLFNCNSNVIVLCNSEGNKIIGIGRSGQGPGEFHELADVRFLSDGGIVAIQRTRASYFDSLGNLLREDKLPIASAYGKLPNGNLVSLMFSEKESREAGFEYKLKIIAADGKAGCELERAELPNPMGARILGVHRQLLYSYSMDRLFVHNQSRGYEVLVYDFDGKLVRRIRKSSRQSPITEEYKSEFIDEIRPIYEMIKNKLYFPEYLPSVHSMVVDERGNLFLATFEEVAKKGGYATDVFNPRGEFMARVLLPVAFQINPLVACAFRKKLYVLHEKGDQLVISIFRYSVE